MKQRTGARVSIRSKRGDARRGPVRHRRPGRALHDVRGDEPRGSPGERAGLARDSRALRRRGGAQRGVGHPRGARRGRAGRARLPGRRGAGRRRRDRGEGSGGGRPGRRPRAPRRRVGHGGPARGPRARGAGRRRRLLLLRLRDLRARPDHDEQQLVLRRVRLAPRDVPVAADRELARDRLRPHGLLDREQRLHRARLQLERDGRRRTGAGLQRHHPEQLAGHGLDRVAPRADHRADHRGPRT